MSPEKRYKIKFTNNGTGFEWPIPIRVKLDMGTAHPPLPGGNGDYVEIPVENTPAFDERDYSPDNNKVLKFTIYSCGSGRPTISNTILFSTPHDHEFHKYKNMDNVVLKKEWTLKLKNLERNGVVIPNGDPPTNVEVGVDEPPVNFKQKQKPEGK